MSHFEAVCTFILLFSIGIGIALSINFRKNPKLLASSIIGSLTVCIIIIILLFIDQKVTQEEIIKDMINSHNGVVISVNKVEGSQTPFGIEVEKYNSVYEVQYRIGNKYYTAWYRSVDLLVTNIKEDLTCSGSRCARFYKEAWLFNE